MVETSSAGSDMTKQRTLSSRIAVRKIYMMQLVYAMMLNRNQNEKHFNENSRNSLNWQSCFYDEHTQHKRLEWKMKFYFHTSSVIKGHENVFEINWNENCICLERLIFGNKFLQNRITLITTILSCENNSFASRKHGLKQILIQKELLYKLKFQYDQISSQGCTRFQNENAKTKLSKNENFRKKARRGCSWFRKWLAILFIAT